MLDMELDQALAKYSSISGVSCNLVNKSKLSDVQSNCALSLRHAILQVELFDDIYRYFCPSGYFHWIMKAPELDGYFIKVGPLIIEQAASPGDIALPVIPLQKAKDIISMLQLTIKSVTNKYKAQEDANTLGSSEFSSDKGRAGDHISSIIKRLRYESMYLTDDNLDVQERLYPFKIENDLKIRLMNGDLQNVEIILTDIVDKARRYKDFVRYKLSFMNLLVVLLRISKEQGIDFESGYGESYISRIINISQFDRLKTESSFLINKFLLAASNTQISSTKNSGIVWKAIIFIQDNYKDISLNDVAAEVGLHPVYFSKIFKDEIGLSYSDYLNQVKIEAAKDYLLNDVPLADVAQLVGFNDQSYFTKIFKKYEGLSPLKWKNLF